MICRVEQSAKRHLIVVKRNYDDLIVCNFQLHGKSFVNTPHMKIYRVDKKGAKIIIVSHIYIE